jgi:hypothetical protein
LCCNNSSDFSHSAEQKLNEVGFFDAVSPRGRNQMEATMPVLLWLLGVPLVVVIALMLTHVI